MNRREGKSDSMIISPDKALETLSDKLVLFVLDIDRVLFDTERFYASRLTEYFGYPEDSGVLDDLILLGTLCAFSEITPKGPHTLQVTKLRNLGIDHYFAQENLHIQKNKKAKIGEILKKYKGGLIILVDDRVEILEEAARIKNEEKIGVDLFTVWIQRGIHAKVALETNRTFSPNATVLSLRELVPIARTVVNTRKVKS